MTQITPNEGENPAKSQEQTHEERSTASGMLSDDSEMDHDAQERSARERLKKASLASMSKKDEQRSSHYGNELPEASAKNESSQPNAKQDSDQKRSSLSSGPDNPRAHDLVDQSRLDTIGLEREGQVADLKTLAADNEHHQLTSSILDEGARERRTDETSDNPAKLDAGRPEKSLVASVLPSETQAEDGERHLKPSNDVEIDLQPPLRVYNPNANSDEEKGTMSPRKKRSRDHLDAEVDREQKIAATEEARAQRFSNEAERAKVEDVYQQKPDGPDHARQTQKSGSIFGNTSQVKAPTPSVRPSSPDRDQSRIPTSNAFASSGFAALASSTASPFGAGASLVPARVGFADSTSTINIASDNAREERHVSGLADKTKTSGIADGHTDTPSVFGGQVFGQSFGNSAISGGKLSSFAAPKGDATFGGNINAIKPIGSTKPQDKDEADSGSDDGDIDNELGKEEGAVDADDRFYTQNVETGEDGEESLFASRASLFSYRNNVWKESGKGVFKFNVTRNAEEDEIVQTGRFIMRAHQTYRVLLNAPVFKQMSVGDSRGSEPTGKSFAFAVIEEGKPVPHMVKVGDENESRSLYRAVRSIQAELE